MEKHLEDLENQLLEQEENHKQILYNLERKAVVDKDRFFYLEIYQFLKPDTLLLKLKNCLCTF